MIQIIQRFRTKHHDLGIHLLHEDYGNITDAIEAQYRPDPNRITEAILQKKPSGHPERRTFRCRLIAGWSKSDTAVWCFTAVRLQPRLLRYLLLRNACQHRCW